MLGNYEIVRKIGEGQFSEVYKIRDPKTKMCFAAKKLLENFNEDNFEKECSEMRMLKLDIHPNILSLLDSVYDGESKVLTLVYELMDMSLYDYIKNRKKCLSETKCKFYLFQLTAGLNHLHRNGIFHRDCKPENILIRCDPYMKQVNPWKAEIVKLADFGSICSINSPLPHSAYVSTRWYRAPECLLTNGYYDQKIDIWALGCVFYEILTLHPMFPGDNEFDQLDKIHHILGTPSETLFARFEHINVDYEFPKHKQIPLRKILPLLSDFGVDALTKILAYHPDRRISAKRLMDHVYFNDFGVKIRSQLSSVSLSMSRSFVQEVPAKILRNPQNPGAPFGNITSTLSLSEEKESHCLLTSKVSFCDKLKQAQTKINRNMERGWGMNSCPLKRKIIGNLKSMDS
jgi:renal tumor antigen